MNGLSLRLSFVCGVDFVFGPSLAIGDVLPGTFYQVDVALTLQQTQLTVFLNGDEINIDISIPVSCAFICFTFLRERERKKK